MKAISQFVVRVFDLIEAEGRTALTVARGEARHIRRYAARLAMAAAVLCIAVPLCLGSVWLMAAGLMMALEPEVGRPLAAALSGLAVLVLGGLCFGGAALLIGRIPRDE